MTNYKKQVIKEFTDILLQNGFEVWLAKSETYGFYTDEKECRVTSFQTGIGSMIEISGNYKPSQESGSGWKMTTPKEFTRETLTACLYENAPFWTNNKNPVYTTKKDHLDAYGSSSKYVKLEKHEND